MEAPDVAVAMVTETELVKLPPLGVIVGVAPVNETAAATLRVKAEVLVAPPPVEVTVTEKLPAGVDRLVAIVRTVEQEGLQDVEEKEAVAPEGSPEAEKETGCVEAEVKLAMIELVTEEPAVTDLSPELESEKSREDATVNDAPVSELAELVLKALPLTTADAVSVMAPA